MPHPASPSFFHVVAVSPCRRPLFRRATDYRALISILRQRLEEAHLRLVCYAVLPSRWELLMGPIRAEDVDAFVRWVASTHAVRRQQGRPLADRHQTGSPTIVVERVDAFGDLLRTCRQIERRAVDHALVLRAEDWPWSSVTERFRLLPRLPLVTSPFLTSSAWLAQVNGSSVGLQQSVIRRGRESTAVRPPLRASLPRPALPQARRRG